MNEPTLTQLKIIVERAVRPIRASLSRKRKMREELLAHICGVFEEERAQLADDQAALERTALRFGDAAEVTRQLQESIPASDGIRRFWEGRPGEASWRTAFRLAWVSGTLAMLSLVALLFAVGGMRVLPLDEAIIMCLGADFALPVYLSGLVFLTDWMEKALYGRKGRFWLKVALVTAGSWLFTMLWCAGLIWHSWPREPELLTATLFAIGLAPMAFLFPYALAKSSAVRLRYHEEWARLPIQPTS
jgi:ATP-dependent Clp protease ATP-binding subunit ClpC